MSATPPSFPLPPGAQISCTQFATQFSLKLGTNWVGFSPNWVATGWDWVGLGGNWVELGRPTQFTPSSPPRLLTEQESHFFARDLLTSQSLTKERNACVCRTLL